MLFFGGELYLKQLDEEEFEFGTGKLLNLWIPPRHKEVNSTATTFGSFI